MDMKMHLRNQLLLFSFYLMIIQAEHHGYENVTQIRVVNFLCNGTTSLLSYVRLQPSFMFAIGTIQERLEHEIYKNFQLNVRQSLEGCSFDSLGYAVDMYTDDPFDVIFGPPSSGKTIGKGLCSCGTFPPVLIFCKID